jgi:hypothetical protein
VSIMEDLDNGISLRRVNWVFTVCSLQGDKLVAFPVFWKW